MTIGDSKLRGNFACLTILLASFGVSASAQDPQNFDSSANGTVKGAYFVRQVFWQTWIR